MKTKLYIILMLLNLLSLDSIGQKMTKITGFVPEARDSSWNVVLSVENPEVIKEDRYMIIKTKTQNGRFSFEFETDKAKMVTLEINGRRLFYPGVFCVLAEPQDSLDFCIKNMNKLGLMDIEVTGKGNEKVDFVKAMIAATFPIYKTDPHKQSIKFKFETTDRKLNAIDSVYRFFPSKLSILAKDIIMAYEYDLILDIPLLSASKNDSSQNMFNKYIIDKKRMDILLKKEVINYYPYHVLGNYVLLSEQNNQKKQLSPNFIQNKPVEYAELIVKHLGQNIPAKEYLLADLTVKRLKSERLSENSKVLYDYFKKNVSINSTFYQEVENLYKYFTTNLMAGEPFYKFTLADTTGISHTLDDFKGKIVVLDFWFYGCKGCVQMANVIDSLEDALSPELIQFISVNVDSKRQWLAGIGKYSSKKSLNLYTGELKTEHPLIKYLNFNSYPKIVVIDRSGKLAKIPPDPRNNKQDFIDFIMSL
ncbi:TlpA family protein disulfide reductase [Chryseobacterium scophthalmum]|uniref:TlpA family protein disulfide reductase n=1 Tax=Chryseobacterium scophthalmum TaxID=59733 RepID=UPI003D02F238